MTHAATLFNLMKPFNLMTPFILMTPFNLKVKN